MLFVIQEDDASLSGGAANTSNATEVVTSTSTSPKKTLPMHPCKISQQQQASSVLSAAQALAQRRAPSFNTNSNCGNGNNSGGRYTNNSSPAPTAGNSEIFYNFVDLLVCAGVLCSELTAL